MTHSILMRRHTVAFLGFLCSIVMHAQRLNVSFAVVAMVNSTALMKPQKTGATECHSSATNVTFMETSRGEFLWDPELQGYILSAGFLGYVLTQVLGGILARRFGTKPVLLSGLLAASVCNLLSPLAAWQHAYFLVAVQLVRGMGQGLQQPALSVLMSKWFPRSERGFLSAFIYCGYPVGAFFTSLISGPLCDSTFMNGWPMVFYVFGLFGMFVFILFVFFFAERPVDDPRMTKAELDFILQCQESDPSKQALPTPWYPMLTSVSTYALIIALFGQYWMAFYFLSVHPAYMGTILNIPIKENGILSSGPHALQAVAGCFTCWISFWLRSKVKTRVGVLRKGCNMISCAVFSVGLIGVYLSGCSTTWNMIFLFVATGSVGFGFGGSLITAVDMSPTFCGPLMGFVSTIASVAGFLVPVTVGNLVKAEQNLAQWGKMFFISTGVAAGSGLVFLLLGSSDIQPWDPSAQKNADNSSSKGKQESPVGDMASSRL